MIVVVELPQVAARQEAQVAVWQRLREFGIGQFGEKLLRLAWMAMRSPVREVLLELVDGECLAPELVARAERGDPQDAGAWAESIDPRIFEHPVVDQHHRANLQERG